MSALRKSAKALAGTCLGEPPGRPGPPGDALAHSSHQTRAVLQEPVREIILHPPSSPDLAPSDFCFLILKNPQGLHHSPVNHVKQTALTR